MAQYLNRTNISCHIYYASCHSCHASCHSCQYRQAISVLLSRPALALLTRPLPAPPIFSDMRQSRVLFLWRVSTLSDLEWSSSYKEAST